MKRPGRVLIYKREKVKNRGWDELVPCLTAPESAVRVDGKAAYRFVQNGNDLAKRLRRREWLSIPDRCHIGTRYRILIPYELQECRVFRRCHRQHLLNQS